MASNLVTSILEIPNPEGWVTPNHWQVRLEWHNGAADPMATYTLDAPHELAAKTLKTALDNVTDATYETLLGAGYVFQ